MAGNKIDLFDEEKVPEDTAHNFAKEIGAIFKLTSALTGQGVDLMFKSIGYKMLGVNIKEENEGKKEEKKEEKNEEENEEKGKEKKENNNKKSPNTIKLELKKEKKKKKKKKCC